LTPNHWNLLTLFFFSVEGAATARTAVLAATSILPKRMMYKDADTNSAKSRGESKLKGAVTDLYVLFAYRWADYVQLRHQGANMEAFYSASGSGLTTLIWEA
jgi:hypothetical protein